MFWLALAAQFSAPVPTNFRDWFSPDDIPSNVQAEGITRVVATKTTVRPDGSIQDCLVERSSGDAQVDGYTCALILKRGKFQEATWLDGSPPFGIFRTPVTWAAGPTDQSSENAYSADMEVTVKQLPRGLPSPIFVRVQIAVGADGKLQACGEAPNYPGFPPPPTKYSNPELISLACDQALKSFVSVPARDSSGNAVSSVQTIAVDFNAQR